MASVAYHDLFWYPRYGTDRINEALKSEWGRLFANWGHVQADAQGHGYPDVGAARPAFVRAGLRHFLEGARLIGMAVAESPELQTRRRRAQHSERHCMMKR